MLRMSFFSSPSIVFFLFLPRFQLESYCFPCKALMVLPSKIFLVQYSVTCDLVVAIGCPVSRIHEMRQVCAFGGSATGSLVFKDPAL